MFFICTWRRRTTTDEQVAGNVDYHQSYPYTFASYDGLRVISVGKFCDYMCIRNLIFECCINWARLLQPRRCLEIKHMKLAFIHYTDVIMGAIASQITSFAIVYSTVHSDVDQRKHQSSASLAFVWGPVNSPHKWPVTWKYFHLMTSSCNNAVSRHGDVQAFQSIYMKMLAVEWWDMYAFTWMLFWRLFPRWIQHSDEP